MPDSPPLCKRLEVIIQRLGHALDEEMLRLPQRSVLQGGAAALVLRSYAELLWPQVHFILSLSFLILRCVLERKIEPASQVDIFTI